MNFIQSLDWSIVTWIQENLRCSFLDFLMPLISFIGNIGLIWILFAIALIVFKQRKHGIILLMGLLVGVIIGNLVLKNLIARPRPCDIDTTIQLLIARPTDFSFPSGHTLSSTIAATILTAVNPKFAIFSVPIASLIAFSRLYLFVHFPTDIFCAILLGISIGIATFIVGRKLAKKQSKETPEQ